MDQKQIEATKQVLDVLAATIKELGEVPSGHLYAQLMEHLNLDLYLFLIGILKKAALVEETGDHLLYWIGPH
jgi:hypothetical protein